MNQARRLPIEVFIAEQIVPLDRDDSDAAMTAARALAHIIVDAHDRGDDGMVWDATSAFGYLVGRLVGAENVWNLSGGNEAVDAAMSRSYELAQKYYP